MLLGTKAFSGELPSFVIALRTAMTGRLVETSACAASGHATDEPAIPVMKSRRLNAPPQTLFE